MPTSNSEWQRRIKNVEREFIAARFALLQTVTEALPGRLTLPDDVRMQNLQAAADNLEGTYFVRLFAEFETCLRTFWQSSRRKDSPSRTRDLVDGIAAYRGVGQVQIDQVHLVRTYRNSLVHERDEASSEVSIATARSSLAHFIKFLPNEW